MAPGKRTGYASLPLHGGKAPTWLFSRMVLLSSEILTHIVEEYGPNEVLRRLSDPFWFQAFGCVLGFDWHSSGVTTTVCGAVKESQRDPGREWGLFASGGKGAASRAARQPRLITPPFRTDISCITTSFCSPLLATGLSLKRLAVFRP